MEDEEILMEYDLYLNQQLSEYLYLLQFPSQQAQKSTTGRMRRQPMQLELETKIDPHNEYYSKERGEILGRGMNNAPLLGAFDIPANDQSQSLLDRQVFTSISLPLAAKYLVGMVQEGYDMLILKNRWRPFNPHCWNDANAS
jgi:DNA-directed RNA polymerase-3 subunit RPC5